MLSLKSLRTDSAETVGAEAHQLLPPKAVSCAFIRAPMSKPIHFHLSKRESQIMDIVYRLGEAGVSEVVEQVPDQPSYNTIRVIMGSLVKKGYLEHREEGNRYVYRPTEALETVQSATMGHMLRTFFHGSSSQAILALLKMSEGLSDEDLEEIARWIDQARTEQAREQSE
jgi:BlaI family transcriptional regulator, penicillinase repressor